MRQLHIKYVFGRQFGGCWRRGAEGRKEPFGSDGCVHYLHCGDDFTGVCERVVCVCVGNIIGNEYSFCLYGTVC